jgi:Tfp pilus assembly protein PilX
MSKSYNSGQALLIVLLAIAVVVVVASSAISRSISDISITTKEEESQRAFSAAEAGVEQALIAGSQQAGSLESANYTASVTSYGVNSREFINPGELTNGDAATVWLVSKDSNGNPSCSGLPCFSGNAIKVCWGKAQTYSNPNLIPAAEVSLYYTTSPFAFQTAKRGFVAYDPNTARRTSNSYLSPDSGTCQIGNQTFQYQKTITMQTDFGVPTLADGDMQFLRVNIRYNTNEAHPVGVVAVGDDLPSQGSKIQSTGTSGQATRRVEVYNLNPDFPPIFDTNMFTQGSLAK